MLLGFVQINCQFMLDKISIIWKERENVTIISGKALKTFAVSSFRNSSYRILNMLMFFEGSSRKIYSVISAESSLKNSC